MSNPFRRPSVWLLLCLATGLLGATANGQGTAPVTRLDKQLARIDLAASGMGEFSTSVTGVNYLNTTLTQQPSNTLGVLLTLRYTRSPLVGFEGNYSYARYTQNFSAYIVGGAQANADEYSVGYVAHLPKLFGLAPFAGAGLGTIAFKPTTFGGQGLKTQARAVYYYDLGIQDDLNPHLGVRASFRQLIYLAPDFGQNYLTIRQRAITSEPTVGVFLRF